MSSRNLETIENALPMLERLAAGDVRLSEQRLAQLAAVVKEIAEFILDEERGKGELD